MFDNLRNQKQEFSSLEEHQLATQNEPPFLSWVLNWNSQIRKCLESHRSLHATIINYWIRQHNHTSITWWFSASLLGASQYHSNSFILATNLVIITLSKSRNTHSLRVAHAKMTITFKSDEQSENYYREFLK